jgi:hypothetical protein
MALQVWQGVAAEAWLLPGAGESGDEQEEK